MCNKCKKSYPPISWFWKNLLKLKYKFDDLYDTPNSKIGEKGKKLVVDENEENLVYENISYCSYTTQPNLLLTTTYQKVLGWTELVVPVGVTYLEGVFTAEESGIYQWTLERIYTNADQNPTETIQLFLEVTKNGNVVFERTLPIDSANNPNEPSSATFTSPFIFSVNSGDYFEFYVKATMGAVDPISTRLIRMQLAANKIHELMN